MTRVILDLSNLLKLQTSSMSGSKPRRGFEGEERASQLMKSFLSSLSKEFGPKTFVDLELHIFSDNSLKYWVEMPKVIDVLSESAIHFEGPNSSPVADWDVLSEASACKASGTEFVIASNDGYRDFYVDYPDIPSFPRFTFDEWGQIKKSFFPKLSPAEISEHFERAVIKDLDHMRFDEMEQLTQSSLFCVNGNCREMGECFYFDYDKATKTTVCAYCGEPTETRIDGSRTREIVLFDSACFDKEQRISIRIGSRYPFQWRKSASDQNSLGFVHLVNSQDSQFFSRRPCWLELVKQDLKVKMVLSDLDDSMHYKIGRGHFKAENSVTPKDGKLVISVGEEVRVAPMAASDSSDYLALRMSGSNWSRMALSRLRPNRQS